MTARTLAVLSAGLMYGSVSHRRRPPSCAWYHILHASHCFSHARHTTPSISSCPRQQRSHDGTDGAGDSEGDAQLVAGDGGARRLHPRTGVVASTYLESVMGDRGTKTGECAICGVGKVSMSDGAVRRLGQAVPEPCAIGVIGTEASSELLRSPVKAPVAGRDRSSGPLRHVDISTTRGSP